MSINYILLGQRIKKFRKWKRMTQCKLAECVDVSPTYMSRVECGKERASLQLLVNIAEALDTSISTLLAGNQSDNTGGFSEDIFILLEGCTNDEKRLVIEVASTFKAFIISKRMNNSF